MSSAFAPNIPAQRRSIPAHDFDDLFSMAHVDAVYQSKQTVLARGQRLDEFGIVLSGWLIRYRLTREGRRQILHVLLPGDFIALESLVGVEPDHDIETITPAVIRRYRAGTVQSKMAESPKLAAGLWRSVVQETRLMREQLVRIGRRSALMSLPQFFLELHQRLLLIGQADMHTMNLLLTQNEIADVLGLSNVHVNRTLQKLKREGLLEVDGQTIRIPNINGLADFCDFDFRDLALDSDFKPLKVRREKVSNLHPKNVH